MSQEYPSIDTIWKRDMSNKGKIILGAYAKQEFEYLANNEWLGTEKVDGTNIRIYWATPTEPVQYGGRTDNAQIPVHLIARLRELFDSVSIVDTLPKAGDSAVTLYGEGYGAKIQKGGGNYKADGCDFVLFDVRVGNWWLTREQVTEVAQALSLDVVPTIFRGTLLEACNVVQAGLTSTWGNFIAEGLVLKPAVDLATRTGQRIVTKIKHRDF